MGSFEEKSLGSSRAEKDTTEASANGKSIEDSVAPREDGKAAEEQLDHVPAAIDEQDLPEAKDRPEGKDLREGKAPPQDALAGQAVSALLNDDRVRGVLYDVKLTLAALRQGQSPAKEGEADNVLAYQESIRRIREVVRKVVPTDATVVVTSKGDEELLDLYGRTAWHFPQALDGTYPGCYPSDGTAVIAHLETIRARGGDYLLFPASAMWWLQSYPKFAHHLEQHYPVVFRDQGTCVIFRLQKRNEVDPSAWRLQLSKLIAEYQERFEVEPAILDWDTGLELEELLHGETVFSPLIVEDGLPYVDQSVPIVAVSSTAEGVQSEARRVASYAVVTLTPLEEAALAPGGEAIGVSEVAIDIARVGVDATESTPSTSIVIPTYNGAEQLRLCLTALEETLPDPFNGEVIVVDDGSGDETRDMLRAWSKSRLSLKVLRNRANSGFVASCNRGAHAATGEILVFLNDDTLPQDGWLPPLLRIFREHPNAGAVGGRLLDPEGKLQEAGNIIFSDGSAANFGRGDYDVDAPLYSHVRKVDYCSAALLATPRALFTELGGFDERYRPAYYEDTDYCFALKQHGCAVYYQPASVIVHVEGATAGTDLSSGVKKFQAVNHVKFVEKWRDALQRQPPHPRRFDTEVWYALAVQEDEA